MSTTADTTETIVGRTLNSTDRPTGEEPHSHDQSDAVPTDPEHSGMGSRAQAAVDIESVKVAGAVDPAISDAADSPVAYDAPNPSRTVEVATRERNRRSKKAEPVELAPPSSPVVSSRSDDAKSLDEEIRLLRDQLTSKLRLQNAQLKRMLERFER
ncbi:hypothetical protein [Agrobacterium sp. a22-2]|uniref:hypothetical protein n=1 Tax=Agrobacterium sp. a22-2 TaxID=2283840 RepID=UPI0034CE66F3